MARARNIKPGFFTNELLAECEPLARIFFEGLWCHADREGRLEWRPKKLKAEILPYDQCDVSDFLGQLIKHGFIIQYEHEGKTFLQVVNFGKHQNPHVKEAASTIPAPGQHHTSTIPAGPLTDSLLLIPDSSSDANASAADAAGQEPIPLDTKAAIFGEQLAWLKENTGRSEGQLRSWLGKCCGQYGEVQVLAAILNIRAGPSPVDPISRMRSILERQAVRNGHRTNSDRKLSPVESLYAGAALALAERERPPDRGTGHDPAEPLLDGGGRPGSAQAANGGLAR